MYISLIFSAFFTKILTGCVHGDFLGCSSFDEGIRLTNDFHSRCSSYCYLHDKSVYHLKMDLCGCTDFTIHYDAQDSTCRKVCSYNPNKYCGFVNKSASYSICDRHRWGFQCGKVCMCLSHRCDLVTGICHKKGCMAGFLGKRCDQLEKNYEKLQHKMDYLRAILKTGFATDVDDLSLSNEFSKKCPVGHYSKRCDLECHCAQNSSCHPVTGECKRGCSKGYVGKRCDQKEPCMEGSECDNEGVCVPIDAVSHECVCKEGWSGVRCQQKDPCEKDSCMNEGKCVSHASRYSCECSSEYMGSRCQLKQPESLDVTMANNFIGCYSIQAEELKHTRRYTNSNKIDKLVCVKLCRQRSFTYAAIMKERQCICSNRHTFIRSGAIWHSECKDTCVGSKEKCGENEIASVFSVCGKQRWGKDCKQKCFCAKFYCHYSTGSCANDDRCMVGWYGDSCDQKLPVEVWFQNTFIIGCTFSMFCLILTLLSMLYVYRTLYKRNHKRLVALARLEQKLDEKLEFYKFLYSEYKNETKD